MRSKLNQIAVDIAIEITYSAEYGKPMPNIFKRIFATCWIFTHEDAYRLFLDIVCDLEDQGW